MLPFYACAFISRWALKLYQHLRLWNAFVLLLLLLQLSFWERYCHTENEAACFKLQFFMMYHSATVQKVGRPNIPAVFKHKFSRNKHLSFGSITRQNLKNEDEFINKRYFSLKAPFAWPGERKAIYYIVYLPASLYTTLTSFVAYF